MKIHTQKTAVTTAAPATLLTTNAHTYDYNNSHKFMAVAIESVSGATIAFSGVEFQMFAYINSTAKPALLYAASVDSSTGRILVPIDIDRIPDYCNVYINQGTVVAVAATTSAANPSFKYELILDDETPDS